MATTDYFLRLETMGPGAPAQIMGESTDKEHKGEIELESFSWGLEQVLNIGSQSSGAGAGKVHYTELTFVARASSATPFLCNLCASGTPMNAVLTCRKAGGKQEEYLKFYFTTVAVARYRSVAVAGTDLIPRDEFSLGFGTYQVEYHPQNKDGSLGAAIKKGWNMIKNINM